QDDVHRGVGTQIGDSAVVILVASRRREKCKRRDDEPRRSHPSASRFRLSASRDHWPRHAAPVASDVAFAGSFALRAGCPLSGGMFVLVLRSTPSYGKRAGIFLPATIGVRLGVHVRL